MKTIQKNSLFSAILLSGAVLLGAATHAKADVNISIGDPFFIPFPFLSFQVDGPRYEYRPAPRYYGYGRPWVERRYYDSPPPRRYSRDYPVRYREAPYGHYRESRYRRDYGPPAPPRYMEGRYRSDAYRSDDRRMEGRWIPR